MRNSPVTASDDFRTWALRIRLIEQVDGFLNGCLSSSTRKSIARQVSSVCTSDSLTSDVVGSQGRLKTTAHLRTDGSLLSLSDSVEESERHVGL